jgi:hypothetical protein
MPRSYLLVQDANDFTADGRVVGFIADSVGFAPKKVGDAIHGCDEIRDGTEEERKTFGANESSY